MNLSFISIGKFSITETINFIVKHCFEKQANWKIHYVASLSRYKIDKKLDYFKMKNFLHQNLENTKDNEFKTIILKKNLNILYCAHTK